MMGPRCRDDRAAAQQPDPAQLGDPAERHEPARLIGLGLIAGVHPAPGLRVAMVVGPPRPMIGSRRWQAANQGGDLPEVHDDHRFAALPQMIAQGPEFSTLGRADWLWRWFEPLVFERPYRGVERRGQSAPRIARGEAAARLDPSDPRLAERGPARKRGLAQPAVAPPGGKRGD